MSDSAINALDEGDELTRQLRCEVYLFRKYARVWQLPWLASLFILLAYELLSRFTFR